MARLASVDGEGMAPAVRWALATGCTITVANIYYIQPLLEAISRDLHVPEHSAGLAATLSQVGYALGMLFIVPLGDLKERRRLVLMTVITTTVIALAMAFSPNFQVLCLCSLCMGISSCTPQLLLPFAAALSLPNERGKTVGFVMSGLLIGILLARTVSGFVGDFFGWRAVFLMAAGVEVAIGAFLMAVLPTNQSDHGGLTYRKALASLPALVREEPVLRESMVFGACLFGAFSAFWTALAFHLKTLGYGPDTVGLFGLVGAAGALAAPIAGRLADQGGPRRTILIATIVTTVSFMLMWPGSILALIPGVLLMDVGVQSAQVTNQSRVYALRPQARSRLNTAYMTAYFIGGSVGSALGTWAWSYGQWPMVCTVGIGLSCVTLANFARTRRAASVSA